ncbi:hypothetical protein JOB18_040782 [Solea senegalensis]|uniref:Myb/SANT-like DNA-binding domain-containing protein n=1 Tax=Solea senegalensis TaxID=28829 RepID=A0AAV6R6X1_SOLSE|nr:zinc finger and SCAN domain-containing protein 29-like [Solea senegalensis]KAG7501141.1 hypothetical protein JOB18_040782 [Solea senegalensis]
MEDYRGWSSDETRCLLALWSDKSVQVKLDMSYRNRAIYEEIAKSMADIGYKRTWLQCQRKIKHLKLAYRKAKDSNKGSGKGRTACPFFEEIDAVVGGRPAYCPGSRDVSDNMEPSNGEETLNGEEQTESDDDAVRIPTASEPSASSTPSTSAASEAEGRRKRCSKVNAAGGSSRRKKSRIHTAIETLTKALEKSEKAEQDLQLKLQAAQHAHETKLISMMLQAMNGQPAFQLPQQTTLPPGSPSSLSPGPGLAAAAACFAFVCCNMFNTNTGQTP